MSCHKCSACGQLFRHSHNHVKHRQNSWGKCTFACLITAQAAIAECGRVVEKSAPEVSLAAMTKAPHGTPFAALQCALQKHIQDDEDVGPFIAQFASVVKNPDTLDSMIRQEFFLWSTPPSPAEVPLLHLLDQASDWIKNRARFEVSMIPGNLRAALLQFSSQDVAEISQNLVFNFRFRETTLVPEARSLLACLWRKSPALREHCNPRDPCAPARLLVSAFHQSNLTACKAPLMTQCVLFRHFRLNAQGDMKMVGCSTNAPVAAAVLSVC